MEQFLGGKGGRAVSKRAIAKFIGCAVAEVGTAGFFPGITLWIVWTVISVRLDDELVAHGIVTREELALVDQWVKKLYKQHGAESPEFRQALAHALGEQIQNRFNQAVENKRTRLVNQHRIARVLDNTIRNPNS